MMKLIKKLLNVSENNNLKIENQKMITREIPSFDFSHFSNHTMVDVVMVPKISNDDKIILHLPENMVDIIDLKMEDHFHIEYKNNVKLINLQLNQNQNPRIEIPSTNLKTLTNSSMGLLKVKEGINIEQKIINRGSGNVSVDSFSGNEISNHSMGKIKIKNINTSSLKLSCSGSGNLEIENGSIDNLKSDTTSMGNVKVNAHIISAQVNSSGSGNTHVSSVNNEANIKLKSMGNVNLTGACAKQVVISSSGSGKVTINDINTQYLDLNLSSMGNVEIVGKSLESEINSSGSGNVNGNFSSFNIKVKMNSMGNISFKPENTLIAKINGMGNLNLLGNDVLDNVEAHLNSMGRLKGGNITTRRLSITGKSNQCDIEVVSPSKKNKL